MSGIRTRLVQMVLRHAERVMPARRAEWLRAMRLEAEHVAIDGRLGFALGCLWSSCRARLSDRPTIVMAGRWSAVAGLTMMAVICMRTAYALAPSAPATLILLLGSIILVAALSIACWGVGRLSSVAVAGLAAALLALLTVIVIGAAPHGAFYRAILVEQCLLWISLFVWARFLRSVEARRQRDG